MNPSETDWHALHGGAHPPLHRKEATAKGVETKRKRGEFREVAAKAVETKHKHGILEEEAIKAAATRKRERKAS